MGQFSNFNFQIADIKYLPLSFINSIPSGGNLSNFIYTPNGAVFEVSTGIKSLIFEYTTFIQRNPSDRTTFFSYYLADLLPSGSPIVDREILLKTPESEAVYLFVNGNYYSVTYDAYNCWGFPTTLKTPLYRIANSTYTSAISISSTLGCKVNDGSSSQLLSQNVRFEIPVDYGVPPAGVSNADLVAIFNKLPLNSSPLKQYIKSKDSASIWYLEAGVRKHLPSYSNFLFLGLTASQFDVLDGFAASSLPTISGIKLGSGQLVKTDTGSQVFVISGNSRVLYATSDSFLAYRNDWGSIETYATSILDNAYPYNSVNVKSFLYDQSTSKIYIVDVNGCYYLDNGLLQSYGQDQTNISSDQGYAASIFAKLATGSCVQGSTFIKQPGQSTVYWVDNGMKHLISKWDTLVNKSNTTNPYVVILSPNFLDTIPTGAPLD
jgi:hypothetical protein